KVIPWMLCASALLACSGSDGSSAVADGDGSHSGGPSTGGSGEGADGGTGTGSDGGGAAATLTATTSPSIALAAGGTASLGVTIARGGWDGDVSVQATGLPSGITAPPITIAKGATTGTLALHASADAKAGDLTVDANGDGLDAKAKVTLAIGKQSVDSSFGKGGVVYLDPYVDGYDFVLDATGRAIVSAFAPNAGGYDRATLIAFGANGQLDTSFGAKGYAVLDDAALSSPGGLAIQPDGKVVVAYETSLGSGGTPRVAVARMLGNGTLDASFGTGGIGIVDFGTCTSLGGTGDVVLQADGTIVVAATLGCTDGTTAYTEGAVARLTTSGAQDASFGTSGKLVLAATTTSSTSVRHVLATSQGLYVLSTHAYYDSSKGHVTDGIITKYDANGKTADSAFAPFTRAGTYDYTPTFSGMLEQPGKGLVWGQNGGGVFGRLVPTTGVLDTTFGDGSTTPGMVGLTETYGGDWDDDDVTALELGPSGNLLLAQSNIPKRAIEVWSYFANGVRDTTGGDADHRIIVPVGYAPAVRRGRMGADGRYVVLTGLTSDPGEPSTALLRFFP
ncbi:MAG: hypothetical protein ABI551_08740, partial [Polyangiaceae bacterium]